FIPGFYKYKKTETVAGQGDKATPITRTYARAAEFRFGAYWSWFNTPHIEEKTLFKENATTPITGSFVRVNKDGYPYYGNKSGVLLAVDIKLPIGETLIAFTRSNAIVSESLTVWEIQFGLTISLSDLSKIF
ncbi:MAG: hypothetical protein IT463_11345, partial [Planctomycetes bacterium]|nr:hypothetical protein [Planctomycetota bacterium]